MEVVWTTINKEDMGAFKFFLAILKTGLKATIK